VGRRYSGDLGHCFIWFFQGDLADTVSAIADEVLSSLAMMTR
jgi:hypothetical protein